MNGEMRYGTGEIILVIRENSMPDNDAMENAADEAATIMLTDAETGARVPAYVIEETELSGKHYLLVTTDDDYDSSEEEDSEFEVMILREIRDDDSDVLYECVTDDTELSAIGKVFEELLDDTEVLV